MKAKDRLLREYDDLVDAIERSATETAWRLATWLRIHINDDGTGDVSYEELSERRGLSVRWLRELRRAAVAFGDDYVATAGPKAHLVALSKHGDLDAAREALRKDPRLSAHSGPMRSVGELRRELSKRTAEERAAFAAELLADRDVAASVAETAKDDAATAEGLTRAFVEVHHHRRDEAARERADRPAAPESPGAIWAVMGDLNHAAARVRSALRELRSVELDDGIREGVRERLVKVTDACGWMESYLDSGATSFDSELEALLAEDAR